MSNTKELYFLDPAYKEYIELPDQIKQEFGFKLWQVQNGRIPENAKKMAGFKGVFELRAWDSDGTYRTMYTTVIDDKIVVIHAFKKKSQKTPKKSLNLLKERFKRAVEEFS